jgi:hypothetical protein
MTCEYHETSNPKCEACSPDNQVMFETSYFWIEQENGSNVIKFEDASDGYKEGVWRHKSEAQKFIDELQRLVDRAF